MNFNRIQVLSSLKFAGKNIGLQYPFYISSPQNVSIDDNVSIAGYLHIWGEGEVSIGKNCLIGSHTAITSVTHNTNSINFNEENIKRSVKIGENVWIGSHCVIVPGVVIEDNVIIGAGTMVNKDLKSNCVYGGVPVKLLYKLEQFKE